MRCEDGARAGGERVARRQRLFGKDIEANGGNFEKSLVMDAGTARTEGRGGGEIRKLRYWIDLSGTPS